MKIQMDSSLPGTACQVLLLTVSAFMTFEVEFHWLHLYDNFIMG